MPKYISGKMGNLIAVMIVLLIFVCFAIAGGMHLLEQNSLSSQAVADEVEKKYIIITVAKNEVMAVSFRSGVGIRFDQFFILLEGITEVSKDYNISQINSIKFRRFSCRFHTSGRAKGPIELVQPTLFLSPFFHTA